MIVVEAMVIDRIVTNKTKPQSIMGVFRSLTYFEGIETSKTLENSRFHEMTALEFQKLSQT